MSNERLLSLSLSLCERLSGFQLEWVVQNTSTGLGMVDKRRLRQTASSIPSWWEPQIGDARDVVDISLSCMVIFE